MKGQLHGTHEGVINAELLAFFKGTECGQSRILSLRRSRYLAEASEIAMSGLPTDAS
jgi:hypothetical protein